MTIVETQKKIIEEFQPLNSLMEKYAYLVKLGKDITPGRQMGRQDDALIRGCQLTTWFRASTEKGRLFFEVDSSSLVVRGAASLLRRIFSGHTPTEIIGAQLFFIEQIGLQDIFSPIRANSLWKIESKIRQAAELALVKI